MFHARKRRHPALFHARKWRHRAARLGLGRAGGLCPARHTEPQLLEFLVGGLQLLHGLVSPLPQPPVVGHATAVAASTAIAAARGRGPELPAAGLVGIVEPRDLARADGLEEPRGLGGLLPVDAAEHDARVAHVARHHHVGLEVGRCPLHLGQGSERGEQLPHLTEVVTGAGGDQHMRLGADNLVAQVVLEAAHDRQYDDHRGDAERDSQDGERGGQRRQTGVVAAAEVAARQQPVVAGGERDLRLLRPWLGHSGRMWGKRMTSRMEALSVSSITRRSIPMPSPAAGGMPYSRART